MTARLRADLATLPAYVPGKVLPNSIKLASNEAAEPAPAAVVQAIADAAAGINRYPDNAAGVLRERLAAYAKVAPEQLHVGCGSVILCQQLIEATCTDGDEVVMAWRSFESYPLAARIVGAVPVQVPLTADARHDLTAMAAAVTERTRIVFVCNPNNPTGTGVGGAELRRFLDTVGPDILVVLDEAYYEYTRAEQAEDYVDGVDIIADYPNVVVLRTFSKAFGLAGLRVGYAIADPAIIAILQRVHVPFSVNALAQAAAIAALEVRGELLARTDGVVAERTRVAMALRAAGYRVPRTHTNFVWLELRAEAAAFVSDAAAAGLVLRGFAGDGVRVTITVPTENDAFLAFALGWEGNRSGDPQ